MHTLTCPCGAIEMKVSGKPLAQFYCHCKDCRKMTSGAYAAESVHRAEDVVVTRGEPAVWTLERNPRWYCAACGGRLFIEVKGRNMRGVNGFLLPAGAFEPQLHVNCESAIMPVRDGLPHFATMPPAFGGTDAKVDW